MTTHLIIRIECETDGLTGADFLPALQHVCDSTTFAGATAEDEATFHLPNGYSTRLRIGKNLQSVVWCKEDIYGRAVDRGYPAGLTNRIANAAIEAASWNRITAVRDDDWLEVDLVIEDAMEELGLA